MCEAMKPAPPVIMIFFGAKSLVCSSAAFLSLLLAGGSLLVAIFKWCPVRWQTSSLQSLELGLCTDFFTQVAWQVCVYGVKVNFRGSRTLKVVIPVKKTPARTPPQKGDHKLIFC